MKTHNFSYILKLDMCLQKSARVILFLTAFSVLIGCGALDAVLPSTGTYKINVKVNNTSFDDLSIISSKDKLQPFFEESVSEDPDITELVVYLKDSRGTTTGYKVIYSLTYYDKDYNHTDEAELQPGNDNLKTEKQDEKKNNAVINGAGENKEKTESPVIDIPANIKHIIKGNVIIFPVNKLDDVLSFIPLPPDLQIGKYTLLFQVMGKNTILYKNEKSFFYLADAEMSFDGIQVNLPGVAENSQFIQNGNVILLDAKINFDSRLDPYVVWYNGKRIIDEGLYSAGAGSLLWKAPEQNGFVSLRAEIFPSWDRSGLEGYQKGISLLVSSKEIDMHLLSEDTPNLVQWYTFEGDLNDLVTKKTEKKNITPVETNKPGWLYSNGTYGLATGDNITYKLPDIPFTNNGKGIWQIISRFKPINEGDLFSVQFGPVFDVTMTLSNKKSDLVLTLASASKTYSETLKLPEDYDSFITVSVKFIIQAGQLSAKLSFIKKPDNIHDSINKKEPLIKPIIIDVKLDKEIKISLGQQITNLADAGETVEVPKPAFTAIWDELAILDVSNIETKTAKKDTKETRAENPGIVKAEAAEAFPSPVMTNPLYIE